MVPCSSRDMNVLLISLVGVMTINCVGYRLFGFFGTVTIIINIVIVIEVTSALSYRNLSGFDIQH